MKIFLIGVLAFALAGFCATSADAAPPTNITNTVGVCDPNAPTHCLAPTSGGAIPTSAATSPPVGYAAQSGNQVSIGATATLVASARVGTAGTGRGQLILNNFLGTAIVYCGPTSGVTTANAPTILVATAGASATLYIQTAEYCIVASGSLTISYDELY